MKIRYLDPKQTILMSIRCPDKQTILLKFRDLDQENYMKEIRVKDPEIYIKKHCNVIAVSEIGRMGQDASSNAIYMERT